MPSHQTDASDPIPARLNATIIVVVTLVQLGILVLLSLGHIGTWGSAALVFVFGITGITTYQVMHEAEHGILFRSPSWNYAGGVWMAALFGGPFTFLRSCHLGHHARNRTTAECFELIWPGQTPWVRVVIFYSFFLFGFWLLVPVSCVCLALSPLSLRRRFILKSARAAAMVQGTPNHWLRRIQREALFVIALHLGLLLTGAVSLHVWCLCYVALGVAWSSQNYLGHAHERSFDVLNGGFNLDVSRIYGAWILYFHWHLAHHQHPSVPWIHLPRYDDKSRPHVRYGRAYLRFLRGPAMAPPGAPAPQVEQAL